LTPSRLHEEAARWAGTREFDADGDEDEDSGSGGMLPAKKKQPAKKKKQPAKQKKQPAKKK